LGTYTLPTEANSPVGAGSSYDTASYSGTSNGNYDYYDDISGLNIGSSTQSLLFNFGVNRGIGDGFTEIQGFDAAPEPSTYALLGLGLVSLLVIRRFRKLTA
jgi:hypothetical protein